MTEVNIERINKTELKIMWTNQTDSHTTIYSSIEPEVSEDNRTLVGQTTDSAYIVTVPENQRLYFFLENEEGSIYVAERRIPLKGAHNFRDFGGYLTKDGHQVKWGYLYRSDHLHSLTEGDIKYLESLRLKTIVDYRTEGERRKQPNKMFPLKIKTLYLTPKAEVAELAGKALNSSNKIEELIKMANMENSQMKIDGTGEIMKEQNRKFVQNPEIAEVYREFLLLFLDKNNVPLDNHCRGGKDRTGYGSALLLYILGVSLDDILYDYELTGILRADRNKKKMSEYAQETENLQVLDFLSSMMETRREYLQAAFDEILTIRPTIDAYISEVLGITVEQQVQLRKLYLY